MWLHTIGLLVALVVAPLAAHTQPSAPVIGFLRIRSPGEATHLVTAFHHGLQEAGYVEGQNVALTYRWAENHYERMPELVNRHVAVIAARKALCL